MFRISRFPAFRLALAATCAGFIAACEPAEAPAPDASATPGPVSQASPDDFPMPSHPETSADITEADLHTRLSIIAGDVFEGRAPGTEAGEASAQWIADEMARVGLKPGDNGNWFQTVEMVATEVDLDTSSLSISINGEEETLKPGTDAVFWTKRQTEAPTDFTDSELVFVGYGIVAPEYDWNDYADLDVAGKTVVMLVNDPGFATNDPDLFNGKAMTYYGRWTYKFEEAARQGATGAIIIHETAPAAYGWNVVSGSWMGEQADLVRKADGMDRVPLEGWFSLDTAKRLFAEAGLDFDAMKMAAQTPGFQYAPMNGLTASGTINQSVKRGASRNVAGMIEGTKQPDEYMLYVAHWDHLGKKVNFASDDSIHNGAVDNASGMSVLLELAEKYAAEPAPERSVMFLAVTLEESGLLGSAYFAENPFIPLDKVVSGINMDGMLPVGRTKNMVVVGHGASQLEDRLKTILDADNRYITPDPQPQNGYFYRSDHISLAKKGVPMLYADGGQDLVVGGTAGGIAAAADYTANRYHKPSDEYDPSFDLSGFQEDAEVFYQLGREIADSADWPEWYEGNEFRAIREASLAGGG